LLFTCVHWHALAKLRTHTDLTLDILDIITVQLGAAFRAFVRNTCPAFDARELHREADSRKRRQQKKAAEGGSSGLTAVASSDDECRKKTFNLERYKYHALGDYADTIRRLGTTDSFSTEPVSNPLGHINLRMLIILCNRANLSIEHVRLGSSARTKKFMSGSWHKLNVVKPVSGASEQMSIKMVAAVPKPWPACLRTITTSDLLKTFMSTSGPFFKNIQEIQLCGCVRTNWIKILQLD
jgi:hypothetical protein